MMKVSAALCTFNGAQFLPQQLASFMAQTRLPDELIACDDASSDATPDVLAAFAKSAPFPVTLVVNERNLGTAANFTQAVSLCSGDVIALCDQDDAWLPEKCARFAAAFDALPNVALLFSDALLAGADLVPNGGTLLQAFGTSARTRRQLTNGNAFAPLLRRSLVAGAAMAFRAALRPLVLPFPAHGPLLHDAWTALLVSAVAEARLVDEPLLLYRQHQNQQTPLHVPMPSLRSASHYHAEWEQLTALRRRLADCAAQFPPRPDALRFLDAKTAHVGRRVSLPPERLRRVWPVLMELARGGYHAHSNGLKSAARDAFVPEKS